MAAPLSIGSPPWSDLPMDMVNEVVGHLDIFSTARLTGVCKSLARAVTANTSLPFGAPCLLMSREEDNYIQEAGSGSGEDDECTTFGLLDLSRSSTSKITTFPAFIKAVRDRWWIGAKDDWLATVDEHCNLRLVNPYSSDEIDLPAVATIPGVEPTGTLGKVRYRHSRWACTLLRIVICETPSDAGNDDDYLVMAVFTGRLLAIARGGDQSWTVLKNTHDRWRDYDDAIVHKGKVFAVDGYTNYMFTWDLGASVCPEQELVRLPSVNRDDDLEYRWNLAELADGCRLLLVYTHGWRDKPKVEIQGFEDQGVILYELDVDAIGSDSVGWSRVTSLGDNALFIGANYPFLASVNRRSSEQLVQPNCVHFAMNETRGYSAQDFDLVVFDLDGREHCQVRLYYSNRYFTFQAPIWFRPKLQEYRRPS